MTTRPQASSPARPAGPRRAGRSTVPRHAPAAALAALLACAACATPPTPEWDGLVRQPSRRLGALFVRPEADVAGYTSVILDPVEVSFARDWTPSRGGRTAGRRLSAGDLAAIQARLAEMFRGIFTAELGRAGYQIVEKPGPDTLRVSAAIVNLRITAPDTQSAGRSRTYTADAGSMTLVLEL